MTKYLWYRKFQGFSDTPPPPRAQRYWEVVQVPPFMPCGCINYDDEDTWSSPRWKSSCMVVAILMTSLSQLHVCLPLDEIISQDGNKAAWLLPARVSG